MTFMENNIDNCKLLYNTERVKLWMPEYGRNVQKMVDYIKTIEDREKRNEQARAVVKLWRYLILRYMCRKTGSRSCGIISISFRASVWMWILLILLHHRRIFMNVRLSYLSRRNLSRLLITAEI